jgi:hypothetical protein
MWCRVSDTRRRRDVSPLSKPTMAGSSFTPPKAARGSAAAHHAQRVALVGRGPAVQVVVFFSLFYLFCFYLLYILNKFLNLNKIRNLNKFEIWTKF